MSDGQNSRPFADVALAERLERAEASLISEGAKAALEREPAGDAFAIDVAGGVAAFGTPGSPLNKVAGLGFGGVPDEAAWQKIEDLYRRRAAKIQVEVSTLGDPGVAAFLTGRGYALVGFENVVGRWLHGVPAEFALRAEAMGVTIEENPLQRLDDWLDVVVEGFATPDTQGVASHEEFPRDVIAAAVRDLSSARGFRRFVARFEGTVAGGASVRFDDGVAQLNGAATLQQFRRRGVQSSLLAARLGVARTLGCDVATATTQPGSKSQQNLHRQGFDLLYARAVLVRE
jgi:GNAT superfamily N-acetyltransferase